MNDLSNKVLSVFLDKQVQSLKDTEISHAIHSQGIKCFPDDVRRIAQQLSPSLFRLSLNRDNSMIIILEPKIEICNAFLSGNCHLKIKPCDKFHICRNFGHCKKPNCRFPHDLYHGQNQLILQENQCLNLDSQLLIQLLRLNNNPRRQTESIPRKVETVRDDVDKQIDVSYPSKQLAKHVDMEIIELMLNTKDIEIEKKFGEGESEVFRRETIQLGRIEDVDKILQEPIIHCENVNIKFKRTKQFIDQSGFQLRVAVSDPSDILTEERISLYVKLLIGNTNPFSLCDFSTANEQIYFVQCQQDIDFDKVKQQYKTRPTLQNHEITINQIYECDQVTIAFQDQNKSMNFDHIERIIPLAQEKIFTFDIVEPHAIDVEFITVQACKQWLSISNRMKTKYGLTVTSMLAIVEENEVANSFTSTSSKRTKITLRPDWAMVAAHPVFEKEYRDYMREQLGGELEIHGAEVIFIGDVSRLPRCPNNESIVVNKTNNYMQKLHYRSFRDLKPFHVRILRANANLIAFSQRNGNDYAVAARPQDLIDLRQKLFPKSKPLEKRHSSMDISPLMSQTPNSPQEPRRTTTKPELFSTNYPITVPEHLRMFTIDSFEERLQKYLQDKFSVKITIERNSTLSQKTKNDKSRFLIKVEGEETDANNAIDELMNLFADIKTNEYNDKTNGNWVKLDEAIDILQHHVSLQKLLCSIQRTSPTSLCINYFEKSIPEFSVDGERIDELINKQFSSASSSLPQQTLTNKFQMEWTNLEEKIRSRDDYRKDICLAKESQSIYLFGLTKLVKEYRQLFEEIKTKVCPQACQINLSKKQTNYLLQVAQAEVNKLAQQYRNDGCDISVSRLVQNGDFLAPIHLHSAIKDSLQALVDLDEITFQIENNAFALWIKEQPNGIPTIVRSKCNFEIQERTNQTEVVVPSSRTVSLEERAAPPPSPTQPQPQSQPFTVIHVNNSTIKIVLGDLTTQKVDVIVVCHTSEILRNAIIKAAGGQVRVEFEAHAVAHQQAFATSNGILPCKKILFLPWRVDQSNLAQLQPSLERFVSSAVEYITANGHQTLAFPSVGCGKLGFDPALIAQHMISAAIKHLKTSKVQLELSFVLIPSQQNVYDEFVKYLNKLSQPSTASPTRTTNRNLKMPFTETTVQITLISTNKNHLNKCKAAISDHATSLVSTADIKKADMLDWPQKTINDYYNFCLKQYVKPTWNRDTSTLDLIGPKNAVQNAERRYYQLSAEIHKEARIHAVARNVIWSVETTMDSNTWEQYSYKLNGLIEDAKLKQHPHIDFIDDKQERCRIDFNSMRELHGSDERRVRRVEADSSLPDKWDHSNPSRTQITLHPSSQEYREVLQQFDATMKSHYQQIVKIERIQNIRWYRQYAAQRDDHQRKYGKIDERSLFHGCLHDSANKIIQECFNRSFAGVNGVAYGCGVYFHAHASYSHSYARASPQTQERTMFLAKVLVGQTCAGNQSMKTPPQGYDTTNDGKHIYVVYHDAGAYADYLITYK